MLAQDAQDPGVSRDPNSDLSDSALYQLQTQITQNHSAVIASLGRFQHVLEAVAPQMVNLHDMGPSETLKGGLDSEALLQQARRILQDVTGSEMTIENDNPLDELEKVFRRIASENSLVTEARDKAEWQVKDLLKKSQEAEANHDLYKELNKKLGDLLTESSVNDEEPIDSELQKCVKEIRHSILAIVQKIDKFQVRTVKIDGWLARSRKDLYDKQKSLFEKCISGVSKSTQAYLTSAAVYDILYGEILSKPFFGQKPKVEEYLRGAEEAITRANPGSIFRNLENGWWMSIKLTELCTLERPTIIARWRTSTFKCFPTLPAMPHQETIPYQVGHLIADFLEPLLKANSKSTSEHDARRKDLHMSTLELAQMAFNLVLRFRRSTAKYSFDNIPKGTSIVSEEELWFETLGYYSQKREVKGSQVELTLFGALVKTPDVDRPTEQCILEKAQVICGP